MPTYSYKCTECGTAFDIQQAFTDNSLTECPNCGGKLRKVFTAIGVSFNGSGFYRNDSRAAKASSDDGGSAKTSDSAQTSDSKSSESKSSESKSDGGKSSDTKASGPTSTSKAPSTLAASPTKAAG